MRTTSLTILAATASIASAINLAPRSENPRVVSIDFEKRDIPDVLAHDRARLRKRENVVSETLDNELTLYYANLTLGTPAQHLQLSIDTGSSDLWVNSAQSSLCASAQNECEGGTYSRSSSSTSKLVNNNFNISYVDGSGATGEYLTDTLGFGGVTLSNFQFGLGVDSSSSMGVLGIGYPINEVQVNRAGGQPYPNLPQALLNAGHINTNAYSLWLNDLDASTGSILFGGVDTAKYSGNLVTVPVIPTDGIYFELAVALSGVSLNGKSMGSSSDLPIAVLLDSGTSLLYLPNDIVTNIYNQVNIVYEQGTAYGYCEDATTSKSLSFTFSGQTINVPFSELYIPVGTLSNGQPVTFQNGKEACIFGVAPADGSTPLLGDTFLRSAYVVYDLTANEISLAQTVYNSSSSNIREITNGSSGVPGATAASTTITSLLNAATGGARLGGASATNSFGGTPTGAAMANQFPAILGAAAAGIAGVAALVL